MTSFTIGEHYYTFSKFKRGLFTIDSSPFLTSSQIALLEERGVYERAARLTSNPSDEDIRLNFPVNLAYYKLPDRKAVYLHSTYTGRTNHTPDRFGNFFSHSLVLKDVQPDFPACVVFDQVPFKKSFPIEEDMQFEPRLGEKMLDITTGEAVLLQQFKHYQQWLLEKDHLYLLENVLDVIVDGWLNDAGKRICICSDQHIVRSLILAVNLLLLQPVAERISFATYVCDPRQYHFQLMGIIPACDITSLDKRYYNFIQHSPGYRYDPRHEYTREMITILQMETVSAFAAWNNLNENIHSFGIVEAGVQLNKPVIFDQFIRNVQQETRLRLQEMLAMKWPADKRLQLNNTVCSNNPELYLEHAIYMVKKEMEYIYGWPGKERIFENAFANYFKDNEQFLKEYFYRFADAFRCAVQNDEALAMLTVLLKIKMNELAEPDWFKDALKTACTWFNEERGNIEDKMNKALLLAQQYKLDDYNDVPGVEKIKTLAGMGSAIKTNQIFDFMLNIFKSKDLQTEETIAGLIHALDQENRKGNFECDFKNYIQLISKHLPEKETLFWRAFFERRETPDINKHSLGYLKRKFLVAVILSGQYSSQLYKWVSLAEYEKKWLIEEISENSNDPKGIKIAEDAFRPSRW